MTPASKPPKSDRGSTSSSTRDRLVAATVALLQEKGPGLSGTAEILAVAAAPRGSFYHHFPEGKDQLVVEAVLQAGSATRASIEERLQDQSVSIAVRVEELLWAIADDQVAHDFRFGCAVGATSLETACVPGPVRDATQEAFGSWSTVLHDAFVVEGLATEEAQALADTVVAAMEGGTMLARARRDAAPLQNAAAMSRRLVDSLVHSK